MNEQADYTHPPTGRPTPEQVRETIDNGRRLRRNSYTIEYTHVVDDKKVVVVVNQKFPVKSTTFSVDR